MGIVCTHCVFNSQVDHSSLKNIYDTLGCMDVIPGPCGLFRYSALGTLKEGILHDYLNLFKDSTRGLIDGNVELVQDRILGTLLSFPPKADEVPSMMPEEGWPRTGFVYEAIFYIEAQRPLSQYVKQRRRWGNGNYATNLWKLREGIISSSNQDTFNKFLSWCMVYLNFFQATVIRLFGPALLIVWIFRFGLFLPDLVQNPKFFFDPTLSPTAFEIDENRLIYGVTLGGLYVSSFFTTLCLFLV